CWPSSATPRTRSTRCSPTGSSARSGSAEATWRGRCTARFHDPCTHSAGTVRHRPRFTRLSRTRELKSDTQWRNFPASLRHVFPRTIAPLTRSFARHSALLAQVTYDRPTGGVLMAFRQFGVAFAFAAAMALAASPAQAVTEIQWWHAMTGGNNDVIVKLANDFNASQSDYKVIPTYKGGYADTMNAGIAACRAGNAPHIMQVFEVGTATMMAATGAVKPVYKLMQETGEKFDPKSYLPAITGYYSTSKGEMLSFPFNSSSA